MFQKPNSSKLSPPPQYGWAGRELNEQSRGGSVEGGAGTAINFQQFSRKKINFDSSKYVAISYVTRTITATDDVAFSRCQYLDDGDNQPARSIQAVRCPFELHDRDPSGPGFVTAGRGTQSHKGDTDSIPAGVNFDDRTKGVFPLRSESHTEQQVDLFPETCIPSHKQVPCVLHDLC